MKLGTRITLLMLTLTVGLSLVLTLLVTLSIGGAARRIAGQDISDAISRYQDAIDRRDRQIDQIVRVLLEGSEPRSLLQAADTPGDSPEKMLALDNLRYEVIGSDVARELKKLDARPAFHVLANVAGDVLLVVSDDKKLQTALSADTGRSWPVDAVASSKDQVTRYQWIDGRLYLVLGVPLRTQLTDSPSHAYFIGFAIDDAWIDRQLVHQEGADRLERPIWAWCMVGNQVVARGASRRRERLDALRPDVLANAPAAPEAVQFTVEDERFLGEVLSNRDQSGDPVRLLLAGSLDEALQPLRQLQRDIALVTVGVCALAALVCRWVAGRIVKPIDLLVAGTDRIAAGDFDHPVTVERRDELGDLARRFNEMAGDLKDHTKLREERVKIERDLALARQIQMDVLPRIVPQLPGYEIATYANPAEETGGDIYDLVPSGPGNAGRLLLLLADATGHGIGPAISVTQVRAMHRIGIRLGAAPHAIADQMNRQLCHDLGSGRFVTAFFGGLDGHNGTLNYLSAGQGPVFVFRAAGKEAEMLDPTAPPLGLVEDAIESMATNIQVSPGDVVVLLTDGFYEQFGPRSEQFGLERVVAAVRSAHEENAPAILAALVSAVHSFAEGEPQLDDMTAIVIRRLPVEAA